MPPSLPPSPAEDVEASAALRTRIRDAMRRFDLDKDYLATRARIPLHTMKRFVSGHMPALPPGLIVLVGDTLSDMLRDYLRHRLAEMDPAFKEWDAPRLAAEKRARAEAAKRSEAQARALAEQALDGAP